MSIVLSVQVSAFVCVFFLYFEGLCVRCVFSVGCIEFDGQEWCS